MLTSTPLLKVWCLSWRMLVAVLLVLSLAPQPAHADSEVPLADNHHYIIFISGWQCLPVMSGEKKNGDPYDPKNEWNTYAESFLMRFDTPEGKVMRKSSFANTFYDNFPFRLTDAPGNNEHNDDRFLYYSYTGEWREGSQDIFPQMYTPNYTYSDTSFHRDTNVNLGFSQGQHCATPDPNALIPSSSAANRERQAVQGSDALFQRRAKYLSKMIQGIVEERFVYEKDDGTSVTLSGRNDRNAIFTIIGHSQGGAIATYWAGSDISQPYRERINAVVSLHAFTKGKIGFDIPSFTIKDAFSEQVVEKTVDSVNNIPIYSVHHKTDRAAVDLNKLENPWLHTELTGSDGIFAHSLGVTSPAVARAVALVIAANHIGDPSKSVPLQAGSHDNPFKWLGAGGGFLFDYRWRAATVPIAIPPYLPSTACSRHNKPEDCFDLKIEGVDSGVWVSVHRPNLNHNLLHQLSDDSDLEWRWDLRVQPPQQPFGGLKLLSSTTTESAFYFSTTKRDQYVEYSGNPLSISGVDIVAIIDVSGSMIGPKLEQAKEAAALLVSQASTNDQIGVVAFSSSSSVVHSLSPANDANKLAAESKIRQLTAGGSTSIGSGLRTALAQVQSGGKPENRRVFVLLSDGEENTSPFWRDVQAEILAGNVAVYTVGLDLNVAMAKALLQEIAARTNGRFYETATAANLIQIYSEIASAVQGRQLYQITQDTISPNSSKEYPARIDSGTKQIQFQLTWPNTSTNLDLVLVDPDGVGIDASSYASYSSSNIKYSRGNTYVIFDVNDPKSGQWKYGVVNSSRALMRQFDGREVERAMTDVDFTVNVNGVSDLTIENISASSTNFFTYEPILLGVNLFDPAPIGNASVIATITKPDGNTAQIQLRTESVDSGPVFAGEYLAQYAPDQIGTYSVRINAAGAANDGATFERSLSFSLFVQQTLQPPADLQTTIVRIPDTDPANPEYCIAYRNDGPVAAQNVYLYLLQNVGALSNSFGTPVDKGDGIYEWQLGAVADGTEATERIRISASATVTDELAYISINDSISLEQSVNPNFDPSTTPTYDPELSNNGGVSSREDVELVINEGWNLLPLPKEFPMRTPAAVLCPFSGQIDVILGFDGQGLTYDPNLPEFSTLTELNPRQGYWFRAKSSGKLRVPGYLLATNEFIQLKKGWNLIPYLPNQDLAVSDALASINGKYDQVLGFNSGAATYTTNVPPQLNTLQQLAPNSAYWIHMLEDAALQYPIDTTLAANITGLMNRYQSTADIAATNEWLNVYSTNSTYNGRPLPFGSVITAIGEDNRPLGAVTVHENGWYGVLAVYHDDAYTPEVDGARTGERINFLINGQPASITNGATPTWTANGDLIQVDLTASGPEMDKFFYLPLVQR